MRALAECSGGREQCLPDYLCRIATPLKLQEWKRELREYPDQALAKLITDGIAEGFRIGYDTGRAPLLAKKGNMGSAAEHAQVVARYLADELAAGRVIRIESPQEAQTLNVHCSPFGVIPKRGRPGKWRLIVNLSAPGGKSVNDGISKESSSLSFVTIEDVVATVRKQGRGALMAKMDIKQAYRNIPVHPQDRLLLGMEWEGQVFVDATLPFGLRSAPLIFTVVADALQWIMKQRGVAHLFH